jgi:UDP-glucuronate 4-epimerase
MFRDFTYIDDIVDGILRVIDHIPTSNQDWSAQNPDPSSSTAPYKIYNIGNSHPVKLMDFIQAIEGAIGHPAEKIYLPMQPGDVYRQMQILRLCRMSWDLSLTNLLKREFRKR